MDFKFINIQKHLPWFLLWLLVMVVFVSLYVLVVWLVFLFVLFLNIRTTPTFGGNFIFHKGGIVSFLGPQIHLLAIAFQRRHFVDTLY